MGPSKTVLFTWELGGGMGHINRLLPISAALNKLGHRVIFALRHPPKSDVISWQIPGALVVQAPLWRSDPAKQQAVKKVAACHYADILFRSGYETPEGLDRLVQAWQRLFDAAKPDLIVCDHSPTPVLVAADRIPVIHIGSGFATPPAAQPLLQLNPKFSAGAKEREVQVLRSMERARTNLGLPVPKQVSDLFVAAENFTCCLPELDPYRSVRSKPPVGPVERLPAPHPLPKEPFVFGYLRGSDLRLPSLLASLVRHKIPCDIYIREAPKEVDAITTGTSVKLYPSPQKLPEALHGASAILHHGGLSTTEAALAVGRPQFLLSTQLEQALTANAVESMRCGVDLSRYKEDHGEIIARLLQQRPFDSQSSGTAAGLARQPQRDVLAIIVEACGRHL
jgi:hypothetical protein